MKRLLFCVACAAGMFLIPDYASAQKQIVVHSEPSDATIYINGVNTNQKTPAIIGKQKGKSFTIGFKKEGYEDGKLLVVKAKQFNGKTEFPSELMGRLTPTPYKKDPTIVAGEANNMVSRDRPGQTALEGTIIRWFFDSDPRGARIFWRVVSSIPQIVKNTNESYLGTIPYEDTRSFNILGLTYENSRDVQIEIKVSKSGYEDQVKRFNVRQAIDQQEISSFFELVKKEQ
ncbi:MAG: PEGA domain-containing protein [Rikenellaceae bacterium]|nr:PEGA domain-containing protein [Rikenellaceae bacterium]